MPYVPGSYVARGMNRAAKSEISAELAKQGIRFGAVSSKTAKSGTKRVISKSLKKNTGVCKKINIKPLKGWKTMEDLIKNLPNITSAKGISTVYQSSGGYAKTISNFKTKTCENKILGGKVWNAGKKCHVG